MTEKRKSVKEIVKKVSKRVLDSLRRAIDQGGLTIDPQQRMDIEQGRRALRDKLIREEKREK